MAYCGNYIFNEDEDFWNQEDGTCLVCGEPVMYLAYEGSHEEPEEYDFRKDCYCRGRSLRDEIPLEHILLDEHGQMLWKILNKALNWGFEIEFSELDVMEISERHGVTFEQMRADSLVRFKNWAFEHYLEKRYGVQVFALFWKKDSKEKAS